jgi:hypothetical protein
MLVRETQANAVGPAPARNRCRDFMPSPRAICYCEWIALTPCTDLPAPPTVKNEYRLFILGPFGWTALSRPHIAEFQRKYRHSAPNAAVGATLAIAM